MEGKNNFVCMDFPDRNFVKGADDSGNLGIIFFIFLTGKFQLPFCTDQTNF